MSAVLTKPHRDQALEVVADNLRAAMARANIGVAALARASDNNPMTVSRIINRLNMPAADSLKRMADALGVTVDSLFDGPG